MDIHEYQEKKILAGFGVTIPRGGIAYSPENAENKAPLSQIKVLAFKEKDEWDLQAKYNIGKKTEDGDTEV